MPQYVSPLMTAPNHQALEIYMGINGKRLNQTEMNARGYTMMMTEHQIIITLPVGGPDGYYKVGHYYLGWYGPDFHSDRWFSSLIVEQRVG